MRIIEYNTHYSQNPERRLSSKIKNILYKDKNPSKLFLEVIKEAGWKTEWAYVHPHHTCYENNFISSDQPQRYLLFPKIELKLTTVDTLLDGNLLGKNILDLGCGAKKGSEESNREPGEFEPWLCRFLHKLGANVIGIDVGDLSEEKFTNYRLDLLKPESLNIFKDNFFDLIHSSALYSSPELQLRVENHHGHGSLEAGKTLVKVLEPQISRILKTGGIYVFREELDYLLKEKRYIDLNMHFDDVIKLYSPLEKFKPRERFEDL